MSLEQKDLSRLLETGIVAARLAGQRAMEELNFIKASVKNSAELVTETDARCQKIITDRIKETYPDHGFVAEEGTGGKMFRQPPRGSELIWWVIDPLDGTNNFAHQMRLFSVSVAAVFEGAPVVGVVFDPATESMFTAFAGGEAQLNGRRIAASQEKINQFSSIGLDSHFDQGIPDWAQQVIIRTRFRNLGSAALQLAYVARGGLIASIDQKVKLWDIAAGTLIAETAGAVVTDWQGNKLFPLDVDSYSGGQFSVLCANKKVHAEILDMLKK